jgi:hypothetical protein
MTTNQWEAFEFMPKSGSTLLVFKCAVSVIGPEKKKMRIHLTSRYYFPIGQQMDEKNKKSFLTNPRPPSSQIVATKRLKSWKARNERWITNKKQGNDDSPTSPPTPPASTSPPTPPAPCSDREER